MKWFLLLIFLIGCRGIYSGATLAERITLGLSQQIAKRDGQYCYVTDTREEYCLVYKGRIK